MSTRASASNTPHFHPLNRPSRVKVEADESRPLAVHLSNRRLSVEAVLETWRIDDEWWLDRPISRLYYRLLLEDGGTVDVYQSVRTGAWFRQAY